MSAARLLFGSVGVVFLLSGCGDAPAPEAGAGDAAPAVDQGAPAWVLELAAIATAIEAKPASGDSILAANGMARARFDSLVYEVAADPALTAAFEAARR